MFNFRTTPNTSNIEKFLVIFMERRVDYFVDFEIAPHLKRQYTHATRCKPMLSFNLNYKFCINIFIYNFPFITFLHAGLNFLL